MFFDDHKRKMSTVIVGTAGKNHPQKNEKTWGGDESLRVIAEDILQAIKDGSSHDLAMSLKDLVTEIQYLDEKQDNEVS